MKTMRSLLVLIAAITVGGFAACNETVGECWYYGEGSENAGVGPGGGVLTPTGPAGVGGYGEGPPKEPLDATRPPPVCNIVSEGPCYDKCDAEDVARAIECAKIQDEAQRRACIDSSYEKIKSCTKECEKTRTSTDMYEACQGKGLPCTREIEAGMTLCGICLNDCLANRPYKYSECYKCGYE